MNQPRKDRIDTLAGTAQVVAIAKAAALKPPKHVKLAKCDKPFFDSVIAEFARSEWTNHGLELAAILARAMSDLVREQAALREEGSVIVAGNGSTKTNPRQTVVNNLATTILSMRRSLSLQAHAKSGDAADIAKRRQIAKTIEADTLAGDLLGLA